MLSTSKVGQRTDGRGERGERRARQSIVTDIPQQQQLRHRHRHGHRHRHRHRHRSVIVVSCFVFVFVSKTKAARKCSTRIVAWLPQCEVCLIMHISTSSSSPLPQRPNHAQFCPLTPPGLGPSLLGLHINKFRGMGEYVSVCEWTTVCVWPSKCGWVCQSVCVCVQLCLTVHLAVYASFKHVFSFSSSLYLSYWLSVALLSR